MDLTFYKNKKILITGHTGFKGTWLCRILINAGADILGYSRCSEKDPNFFEMADVKKDLTHIKGDVRDYGHLLKAFTSFQPEIVFHLAAQPIVRESYDDPVYTYETNVMGTVNVLECIRQTPSVRSAVIITTDKVYRNNEWEWGYRETDVLDGYDPYSNSKSCAELAAATYRRSFLDTAGVAVSTARAGNVIGGGDFARARIIPDCIRAVQKGEPIIVRNPNSVRPYQHVLEPLFAYLLIAEKQFQDSSLSGSYNIGPEDKDCITTGELVELFCKCWGEGAEWKTAGEESGPHEAGLLKLDCSLVKKVFGWEPVWHIEMVVEQIVRFNKLHLTGNSIVQEMLDEILYYISI